MAGLHEHRGVTVIEVGGEIDVFTCRLLRELLLSILSRGSSTW
jgi:anti-anti-sigma regulatory factor